MGIGALLLAALYALPLWSIQLFAPQYPEGLGMTVRLSTITGARPSDLDTINELNHYIGMKPIEPGAVTELRYFPYIVGVLIVLGVAAALFGKRKLVVAWLAGVALFGAAGLADFWRWAYDYGHNIDTEHAIIKMKDGSTVEADAAWEDAQGVWFRRSGLVSFVEKSRVEAITEPQRKPAASETKAP